MNTPTSTSTTSTRQTARPVGVVHLVFGLIFCGIAALWMIGIASNADFPNLAKGVPVVLIGAGIVGLGASTVNHRRARARLLPREPVETHDEPAEVADVTSTDSVAHVADHTTDPTTSIDLTKEES